MAIYHLSIKIISRGQGKSAVAAAAYRAGEKITNRYDGIEHDYTRKGGVVHTEILLPGHAPKEYADRAVLWNAVEKCERYKTAQLARELEIALPVELPGAESISLVREYVKRHFVAAGMCADIAVHDKGDGNPHAHIMLTMRPIEQDGTWGQKSRQVDGVKVHTVDWHEHTKAGEWRKGWADLCNACLERGGHAARIDHRSYARQGSPQIPTVHLGVAASQMERKGIRTERGDINRRIEVTNSALRQMRARIAKLESWVKAEAANDEPPTLAGVIRGILDREQSNRYGTVRDLKVAAKTLAFLTADGITDMDGLREKVHGLYDRRGKMGSELNRIDRRMKTLDEHLRQAGNYGGYKDLYAKWQAIPNQKRKAQFREEHHAGIALYESAKRYLDDVMNGHKTLPLKAWRDERGRLTAERGKLNLEYAALKNEVKEIEQIRRVTESVIRDEQRGERHTRTQDMER